MKDQLTAYLKAHNITLYKFCKDNGFKYSTAQNWVKGKSLPSYENLEKLNKIIK
jgi:transcriptional regulator with XRE-family HTH domain